MENSTPTPYSCCSNGVLCTLTPSSNRPRLLPLQGAKSSSQIRHSSPCSPQEASRGTRPGVGSPLDQTPGRAMHVPTRQPRASALCLCPSIPGGSQQPPPSSSCPLCTPSLWGPLLPPDPVASPLSPTPTSWETRELPVPCVAGPPRH